MSLFYWFFFLRQPTMYNIHFQHTNVRDCPHLTDNQFHRYHFEPSFSNSGKESRSEMGSKHEVNERQCTAYQTLYTQCLPMEMPIFSSLSRCGNNAISTGADQPTSQRPSVWAFRQQNLTLSGITNLGPRKC